MKTRISVQERLKDLRVERGLNLEELAQETGISKSALKQLRKAYKKYRHRILLQRLKREFLPAPYFAMAL